MADEDQTPEDAAEESTPQQRVLVTKEEIEEMLCNDPRVQEHFADFNAESVKAFIGHYAMNKAVWQNHGQRLLDLNAQESAQWIDAAKSHLDCIQQKKLFDLQCLWRAEQITFPEIEISYDFEIWGTKIFECPFLEPITKEEVALYLRYLAQLDLDLFSEKPSVIGWQSHPVIKNAHLSDEDGRPDWYEFHNTYTGAASYLSLPDIRKEKESFYLKLAYEYKQATAPPPKPTPDTPPAYRRSVYYSDEKLVDAFVKKFEDGRMRGYYEAYKHRNRHGWDRIELHEIVDELLKTDETIPIEAHYDFGEALRRALRRHEMHKVVEHIPLAYEEYLTNLSLGLSTVQEGHRLPFDDVRKMYADAILEGRKAAGEPEDFNF